MIDAIECFAKVKKSQDRGFIVVHVHAHGFSDIQDSSNSAVMFPET